MSELYILTCELTMEVNFNIRINPGRIYLGCIESFDRAKREMERNVLDDYVQRGYTDYDDCRVYEYVHKHGHGEQIFTIQKVTFETDEKKALEKKVKDLEDKVKYLEGYIKAHGSVPVEPKFNSKPIKKEEPKHERKFSF